MGDQPRLRKPRPGAGGVIKIVTQTVSRATQVEQKSRNRFQLEGKGRVGRREGGESAMAVRPVGRAALSFSVSKVDLFSEVI